MRVGPESNDCGLMRRGEDTSEHTREESHVTREAEMGETSQQAKE